MEENAHRGRALALLCLAQFMVILDGQIVLLALPSIQADLGLSAGAAQWLLSGYLLSFGGLLLLGGRSADRLGRRRMFRAGTALFLASSLLCGLAWSGGALIAARVVQGVSAAIMAPTALSMLMTTFPEGPERNRALGVWSSVGGAGATGALLIGGPLTEWLGWPAIFLLNVPVAVLLLVLAPRLLAESRADVEVEHYDAGGAITITAALVLLVYAVVEAPDAGWSSPRTLALLAGAALLLRLFVAAERRSPAPLAPLRIFRSRTLVGGNLVLVALGMTAFGMSLVLTRYAQDVLGWSAVEFGLGTAAMTVMTVAGSAAGQALVTRTGPAPVAAGGLVLCGLGCLLLAGAPADGSYAADVLPGLLVFGPGLGATFVAASAATLAGVEEREAGLASALNTASFQLGGALGAAVATSVALEQAAGPSGAGLTQGLQAAFAAAVVFAAVGIACTRLLRRYASA